MTRQRLNPEVRKDQLLAAALTVAAKVGYQNVTRDAIASAAGLSPAMVNVQFGTMPAMKRAIMRAAVTRGVVAVVAQGLADGNAHARKAPPELKKQAADMLCR